MLAFVTRPLQRRLAARIHPSVAAAVVVLLTVLVAVLPVVLTVGAVADDVAALTSGLSLEEIPNAEQIEAIVERYTGREIDVEARLRPGLRSAGPTLRRVSLASDLRHTGVIAS